MANLKPSIKTISLRLPESMIEELKRMTNKRNVPHLELVRVFLSDRIAQELTSKGHDLSANQPPGRSGSI